MGIRSVMFRTTPSKRTPCPFFAINYGYLINVHHTTKRSTVLRVQLQGTWYCNRDSGFISCMTYQVLYSTTSTPSSELQIHIQFNTYILYVWIQYECSEYGAVRTVQFVLLARISASSLVARFRSYCVPSEVWYLYNGSWEREGWKDHLLDTLSNYQCEARTWRKWTASCNFQLRWWITGFATQQLSVLQCNSRVFVDNWLQPGRRR